MDTNGHECSFLSTEDPEETEGLRLLGGSSRFAQVKITSCGSSLRKSFYHEWTRMFIFVH